MAEPNKATRMEMGLFTEGFPALSSMARDFVRRHPREARLAVAVALETAAAQHEAGDTDETFEISEKLRRFIVRPTGGRDILGVSEAAARLEVSRTTVYDWIDRNTLIAWKATRRGFSVPVAQILGPGKVVAGLADVAAAIGDPELAWAFLTQEWPFGDTAATPLELLKAGRLGEVLDAAPGFGNTFT